MSKNKNKNLRDICYVVEHRTWILFDKGDGWCRRQNLVVTDCGIDEPNKNKQVTDHITDRVGTELFMNSWTIYLLEIKCYHLFSSSLVHWEDKNFRYNMGPYEEMILFIRFCTQLWKWKYFYEESLRGPLKKIKSIRLV